LAAREIRGKTAVVLRLYSNAIEQRRIGRHEAIMRVCGGVVQDLTAGKSARRSDTPNVLLPPNPAGLDRI
jgi:3-dehydroquinate synthetase